MDIHRFTKGLAFVDVNYDDLICNTLQCEGECGCGTDCAGADYGDLGHKTYLLSVILSVSVRERTVESGHA